MKRFELPKDTIPKHWPSDSAMLDYCRQSVADGAGGEGFQLSFMIGATFPDIRPLKCDYAAARLLRTQPLKAPMLLLQLEDRSV